MSHGTFLAVQVGRFALNVTLAYVVAGLTLVAGLAISFALNPPEGGPGVGETALYAWFWLIVGLPAVLLGLGLLDLFLRATPWSQRRSAIGYSMIPGLVGIVPLLVVPALFSIVAWLLATGLVFGLLMRLPPRQVAISSRDR